MYYLVEFDWDRKRIVWIKVKPSAASCPASTTTVLEPSIPVGFLPH
jgi:hypothetical protein